MTPRSRALYAMGAFSVLVVLLFIADSPRRRQHDDDVRRGLNERAQALKDRLDRHFPLGTAQAEVVAFLRKQPTHWRDEAKDRYWLSIGRGPSGVWYCGSIDVGIWAKFEAGRLTSTEVGTWSFDCL